MAGVFRRPFVRPLRRAVPAPVTAVAGATSDVVKRHTVNASHYRQQFRAPARRPLPQSLTAAVPSLVHPPSRHQPPAWLYAPGFDVRPRRSIPPTVTAPAPSLTAPPPRHKPPAWTYRQPFEARPRRPVPATLTPAVPGLTAPPPRHRPPLWLYRLHFESRARRPTTAFEPTGEHVPATTTTAIDLLAQLDTDLAAFFPGDGSGFDSDCIGPDGTIRGVFTDESYEGGRDGPHVWIKESDLGTITHGSTLTIASIAFTVDGLRPDGVGLINVLLEQ